MDIRLRKAMETDEEFLLRLRMLTMREHLEAAEIFLTEEEHLERMRSSFESAYVIECSGERVGLAKYLQLDACVEVLQLQVLPAWQGMGIGGRALQSLVEKATRDGCRLTLNVLKNNPAKRLYEKLGFRVVGEDKHEFHMLYESPDHSG